MAYTEHLPIYKAAYDLCLWLEQVVRGFPRYHKSAIGSDLPACPGRAFAQIAADRVLEAGG